MFMGLNPETALAARPVADARDHPNAQVGPTLSFMRTGTVDRCPARL